MERCKSCAHYDKERSVEGKWTVCPVMPVSVMMAQSSKDCPKYEAPPCQK
jgi:hypothetical protein